MSNIKVRYEELFPEEFKKRLEKTSIAYLPLGSMEYHGYHNVLGLDSLKAWKICEIAASKYGGIVFPPLYLGVDTWPDIDLQKYPNKQFDCYHIPKETYAGVLGEYFYRINRIGFKKLFVLCGHYPNVDIAREVAKKFSNFQVIIKNEADLVTGEKGDHAGVWETSLMMYLFPDYVDLNKMEGKEDRLMAVDGEDPAGSTKKLGKKYLSKIIKGMKKLLSKDSKKNS